jgi:uncharacterized membrane protein YdfJ with MMPL/SSD domain
LIYRPTTLVSCVIAQTASCWLVTVVAQVQLLPHLISILSSQMFKNKRQVKKKNMQRETQGWMWLILLAACFLLLSCLSYPLTLKTEAICFSKYQWNFTGLHISEKHNRSLKVMVQGLDFMAHPLYIHILVSQNIVPSEIQWFAW